MSIRLKSMNVKGLGPIAFFDVEFKDITVIFGHNESGKTYLTDFLLHSLFKGFTASRDESGSGQVTCQVDGQIETTFTPYKRQERIDDLLFPDRTPSRIDLMRLFTVRGGLPTLTQDSRLKRTHLREMFSDQTVGETILGEIKPCIEYSEGKYHVTNGTYSIAKDYRTAEREYKEIIEFIDEVNTNLALGEIFDFEKQLRELEKEQSTLREEKQKIAGSLKRRIDELDLELDGISISDLTVTRQDHAARENCIENIKDLDALKAKLGGEVELLNWLQKAIDEYKEIKKGIKFNYSWVGNGLVACNLIICILVGSINPKLSYLLISISLILLVISAFLNFQYIKSIKTQVEEQSILDEFQEKFGKPAKSLVTLLATLEEYKKYESEYQVTCGQLKAKHDELDQIDARLENYSISLFGVHIDLSIILGEIEQLESKRHELERKKKELTIQLDRIDIGSSDYLFGHSDLSFEEVDTMLKNIEQQLKNVKILKDGNLSERLRQEAIKLTNLPQSTGWDRLFEELREVMKKRLGTFKRVKAEAHSQIIISQVVKEIKDSEDRIIDSSLASQNIIQPIQTFTPYSSISCVGETIVIGKATSSYSLDDLSTGTKEQVLMALRVGFANHVLRNKKMFFILDDAFQHSDYPRREKMVRQLGLLAHAGWQIVYFTMDDHIRSLFEKIIAPDFKDRYQYKELHPDIAS